MQFNPYLSFNGDCEEAFKFYEQLLGGKIEAMFRHEGSPAASHVPPEWGQKILHARKGFRLTSPPAIRSKPNAFSAPWSRVVPCPCLFRRLSGPSDSAWFRTASAFRG